MTETYSLRINNKQVFTGDCLIDVEFHKETPDKQITRVMRIYSVKQLFKLLEGI